MDDFSYFARFSRIAYTSFDQLGLLCVMLGRDHAEIWLVMVT